MKRNLDTLRYVLMTTENLDNNLVFVDNYVTDKYSFNEISFHIFYHSFRFAQGTNKL